jgi:hypothetical protein
VARGYEGCRPRRLASALCVAAVCLVVAPLSAQVFVSNGSGGEGRGVLRKRDGECFLITPRHVATKPVNGRRDTVPDDPIRVVLIQRVEFRASYRTGYADDIAILKLVSDGPVVDCPAVWDLGSWNTGAEDAATLVVVSAAGTPRRIPVRVVDDSERIIRVLSTSGVPLAGRMSGSLLRTEQGPAGMLLSVKEDKTGVVLRMDYISQITHSFFNRRTVEYAAELLWIASIEDEVVHEEVMRGVAREFSMLRPDSLRSDPLVAAANRGELPAACELAANLAVEKVLFGQLRTVPSAPRRGQPGMRAISEVFLLRAGDCQGAHRVLIDQPLEQYASSSTYARMALAKAVSEALVKEISREP